MLAVQAGVFDDLRPEELAGVASALTYEHRSRIPAPPPTFASPAMAERTAQLEEVAARLRRQEERCGVETTRAPDATLLAAVHGWASGHDLDEMLPDDLGSPGDFVRNVRRLIDLCGQLAAITDVAATRSAARRAVEMLRRGIVSAGDVEIGTAIVEGAEATT